MTPLQRRAGAHDRLADDVVDKVTVRDIIKNFDKVLGAENRYGERRAPPSTNITSVATEATLIEPTTPAPDIPKGARKILTNQTSMGSVDEDSGSYPFTHNIRRSSSHPDLSSIPFNIRRRQALQTTISVQQGLPVTLLEEPAVRSPGPDPTQPLQDSEFLVKNLRGTDSLFPWSKRAEQRLCWQAVPLKRSLLKLARQDGATAIDIFNDIDSFMGHGGHRPAKERLILSQQIANIGAQTSSLRDEILLQIAKQMTLNPDPNAIVEGFKLFIVCASTFAPSADLRPAMLNWASTAPAIAFPSLLNGLAPVAQTCRQLQKLTCWILHVGVDSIGSGPFKLDVVDNYAINGVPSTRVSFGASLSWIMQLQTHEGNPRSVPSLFDALLRRLMELGANVVEGIFRVSADVAKVKRLKAQLIGIPRGAAVEINETDPVVVADLIKAWLRSLHPPVIPFDCYSACIAAANDPTACVRIAHVRLPIEHFNVLDVLVTFLQSLSQFREATRMGASNLAIVFAPNLMRAEVIDPFMIMHDTKACSQFLTNLIEHWPPPTS